RKSICMTSQLRHYNSATTESETHMNPTVPLTVLALELGTTADVLAAKFRDDVTLDDIGIRCVSADTARQFLADHRAARQEAHDREAARREEARRRGNPLQDRVKALQIAQAPFRGSDVPAAARALAAGHENRPFDETLYPAGAAMTYH